jgi:hypothetical protein
MPKSSNSNTLAVGGKDVQGVNTNKCESVYKLTTIRARRMFISSDFSVNSQPRRTYFLQHSSKLLKAAAKVTAISDLATPSQAFLISFWSRLWPASPHFGFF